jgi:hypothetical protein
MTHAIKGRSSVTHNTSNVLFVIPCFINRIPETSTFIPLECVQSQNNPVDGLALHSVQSVAASPQQVSLFLAQPEYLEQGPEKTESASEVKIHQAIDGRYKKL